MDVIDLILGTLTKGWVGSIIGLLGLAAAVITYVLTRQRTLLVYRSTGDRLLGLTGELPPEITVQFHGQNIPRLTRSLVVIWNAGEKTISRADIALGDPLRIVLPDDSRILSSAVLRASRDVIQFTCEPDANTANEANIHFEFLDAGDGAVLEFLHTSEARHTAIRGTIRGLPKGIRSGPILGRRVIRGAIQIPRFLSPRLIGWVAIGTGLVITATGLLVPWTELEQSAEKEVRPDLVLASAGFFYVALGLVLTWLTRRRYPKTLHIDSLE